VIPKFECSKQPASVGGSEKAARRFRVAATGLEKEIPGKKTDQNPGIGKVCSNLGGLGSRKYGSGKETRRPLPNGYRIGDVQKIACRIPLVTRSPALDLNDSNVDYATWTMATIDVVLPRDSNHFAADFAELNIVSLEGDSLLRHFGERQ
jgi:hypothetical protein